MGWHLMGALRAAATVLLRLLPIDPAVTRSVVDGLRQVLTSGVSLTGPFVVTLVVLGVVVDFVGGILTPLVQAMTLLGLTAGHEGLLAQVVSLAILFGVVVLAGLVAESGPSTGVERRLGRAIESVPGVGSMYSSFDRMSDVMLESDSGSFREVKLVEFPHADIYSLAFVTAEVEDSTPDVEGEPMQVLFVPMAPNPVMGGFMVCVPDHRVMDVDMTVQEAFQAIVTSGVAMAGADGR